MEDTSFISISKTASADAPFRLTDAYLRIHDGNFHCATNDAYYGDGTTLESDVLAGDVLPYEGGRLDQIWFKNKVAGNNCKITFVGSVYTRDLEGR